MLTSFFSTLQGIPIIAKYLLTVLVGMTPIIEIRGAIPLGVAMGLDYWSAYICSFIGNIIPIFSFLDIAMLLLSSIILFIFSLNDYKITKLESVIMVMICIFYYICIFL